jgi:hypothetical protein
MKLSRHLFALVAVFALALLLVAPLAAQAPAGGAPTPAAAAFDRLAALAGDWVDMDGSYGGKDQVIVTYRLTGYGTALVETLFPGQPHEMVTVYHKDGNDLVLTHYCAEGNQPHMRAKTFAGNALAFDFDGGTNLDPAKDSHMHSCRMEFVSADEIRGEWVGWDKGKPAEPLVKFHMKRKAA